MRASCVVRRASAWALVSLAACSPTTTRPPFTPVPEALRAVINARPPVVTGEAEALLKADRIPLRFVSTKDAFLETAEFDGTTRIRLWADPDVPGKARVTIEAVYRPIEDPSRTRRDLERPVPFGAPGHEAATRLMEKLKEKLGETVY
jgi:hypothetical protein